MVFLVVYELLSPEGLVYKLVSPAGRVEKEDVLAPDRLNERALTVFLLAATVVFLLALTF